MEESTHVVFYETNVAPRKGIIIDDEVDIEDQNIEEPKEKKQKDSKEDPPLKDLQRKED